MPSNCKFLKQKEIIWEKVTPSPAQPTRDVSTKNMLQHICMCICIHRKKEKEEKDRWKDK